MGLTPQGIVRRRQTRVVKVVENGFVAGEAGRTRMRAVVEEGRSRRSELNKMGGSTRMDSQLVLLTFRQRARHACNITKRCRLSRRVGPMAGRGGWRLEMLMVDSLLERDEGRVRCPPTSSSVRSAPLSPAGACPVVVSCPRRSPCRSGSSPYVARLTAKLESWQPRTDENERSSSGPPSF